MSVPRYPKYKDSGVEWLGEVPAHWKVISVKRDLEFITSGSRGWAENYADEGELFIRIANLTRNGIGLDLSDIQRVAVPNGAEGSRTRVKPGDVLFSITAFLGSVAVVPDTLETAYVSQHVALVRLRQNHLSPKWLGYAALSLVGRTWFDTQSYGGTKIQLSLDDVRNLPVPVPPAPEQRAIIDYIDRETAKIDALVVEQQRLIELLTEKRQAVISHAVTKGLNPDVPMKPSGLEWLGEIPAHWEVRRIASLSTKITNGYVGPTRDIFVDDGIRYLQSLHIKDNKIRFDVPYFVSAEWSRQHSKSILEVGDVLIVQTGDIGQAAAVTTEFAGCNCHALIIVSPVREVVEGNWIALVLNAEFGRQSLLSIQTGALHPHLNCGDVKDLSIPLPPLVEQRQIIKRVSEQTHSLDALNAEAERAIDLLQERRAALISAAVTGQIDVRGIAERTAA